MDERTTQDQPLAIPPVEGPPERDAGWDATRNVLCVRLDALGDVLMTTPAIRALTRPDRRIPLLT